VLVLVASAWAAVVSAQTQNYTIDPATVPIGTRVSWCNGQFNSCNQLCGGASDTKTDYCNQNNLTYSCICNNGSAPDLAVYQNTMPFYLCQAEFAACIAANDQSASGQEGCKKTYSCGTLNASDVQTGSSASSSASASSSSSAPSKTSSTAAPSATHNAAAALGANYGTGVVAGAVLLAFKLLL